MAQALSELDQACANLDVWSQKQYQDSITAHHRVWLTKNRSAVMVWTMAIDEAELLHFFVVPTHQKQGIGYYLLQYALRAAKKAGALHMFLEVRASNDQAIRLYKRCGLVLYGTRKNYYPTQTGEYEDAWLMKKAL